MKNNTEMPGMPETMRVHSAASRKSGARRGSQSPFSSAVASRLGLTERENEVMGHLARGLLYKEIADDMNVSYAAVHKLQHKIFRKLQVTNRTEAVVRWLIIGHDRIGDAAPFQREA